MGCGTNIASPDFVESIAEQLQTLGTHAVFGVKEEFKVFNLARVDSLLAGVVRVT